MKKLTMLTFLLSLALNTDIATADTKQKAAQKKLESYGCKLIQDATGKSSYQCKSDAPKSLIEYYTQIVQK
ncbi:MAG: hypothetical protein VW954_00410 [Alphaproteobacteria bacterium]|jgi:hypothetical protein|tara:strand:- start:999 stop:1211 length:213 start_codon:yes stop_codon:yes gene_type:complete